MKNQTVDGPASTSAQAGSRPGWCLRRPASGPAQTGGKAGGWPEGSGLVAGQAGAQAGSRNGDAAVVAGDDPFPAALRGTSTCKSAWFRAGACASACGRWGSAGRHARARRGMAMAGGRRHPALMRGHRGGGREKGCPRGARAHQGRVTGRGWSEEVRAAGIWRRRRRRAEDGVGKKTRD